MALRFHLTYVRMAKIKTSVTAHGSKGVKQGEHSSIAGGNRKMHNHFRKQYIGCSENWEWFYLETKLYPSWAYALGLFNQALVQIQELNHDPELRS